MRWTLLLLIPLLAGCTDAAEEPEEPLDEESADEPVEEEVDLAALCPTDTDAVEAGPYWMTPQDATGGAFWIYEESNGMPGLQRNDDTVPTDCPQPDTIIL